MAEQRRTFWIGIISALAALIKAGTSVYVTLREEVRVARPPGAGEAPLAEVERLLERYERRLAGLETERRRLAEDGEEMADPGEFYASPMATACSKSCRWMGVGRLCHCRSTAAPRHCKIRSSPSERSTGLSRLSSDAGPGAPPSLSHLARALASELLGFGRFDFLAIMHERRHAEEPAATGNEGPMSSAPERRSLRVQGAKVLNPEIASVILDAHLENITIVRVIDLVNLSQTHHLTVIGKSK